MSDLKSSVEINSVMDLNQRKVRIAIVGIGGRGTWATEKLAHDINYELVALCDRNLRGLRRVKEKLRLVHIPGFSEISDCLEKVDVDAVVVMTSDSHHAEVVIPVLKSGKYVFVDKPLEVTEANCRLIIRADRKAGGKTFVGFNLRYAPMYVKIKELIDAGAIGRILTIQADEFYDGGRTYFRRWNRLRKFSGGLWITKACHDFDLLCWLAGKKPLAVQSFARLSHYRLRSDASLYCDHCDARETCPDSYYTYGVNDVDGRKRLVESVKLAIEDETPRPDLCLYNSEKDTFDHGMATVEFEEDILATYTCNVVAGFSDRRIRVSGTKGAIDGELSGKVIGIRRRDPSTVEGVAIESGQGEHGGADHILFNHFQEFVKGQITRMVSPQEGMIPILLGLAATRSVDEGRLVKMCKRRSENVLKPPV
ncbi:MAG: Gfo/Idh/MocA family oxidoreductase [Verrucomicrobiae bacterium]|nr:Gfo/Idh/MocA family oxidoreductase [Verrucomicrobiae bacterium]